MERQNAHIAMPGNILPKPVYVAIASLDITECISCALGNGVSLISALSPTGRLEDTNAIRMRDNDENSPTFDSEGVVRGRVEVMKNDQLGWATVNSLLWDDGDAFITCRQIGTDLGYITVSREALEPSDIPVGSGETISIEVCPPGTQNILLCPPSNPLDIGFLGDLTYEMDVGIKCEFRQPVKMTCAICPAGTYSDAIGTSICTSCSEGTANANPVHKLHGRSLQQHARRHFSRHMSRVRGWEDEQRRSDFLHELRAWFICRVWRSSLYFV
ncbi:hypothetical protein TrLO_g13708 [Triparma laevis f. longispina]|uniref:SRCR domain-containing protein n=1 Tax=Triparma laevis f. longispina TaxID=1714387 RepID=A0A9W7AI00_9STRA|nr:hypothetical protein TrLO_g13708 [Triparma laevis f. longispina]